MSEAAGATATQAAAPSGGEAAGSTVQNQAAESAQAEAVTESAETEVETGEATETVKPKRKTAKEWAKESLEQDFDDDDTADDYLRNEVVNSRKLNKQLMEYFDENPEVGAAVSKALKDGVPFAAAMAAYMSPEEYAEAVEMAEGGKEALAARKEQLAKMKEHDALVDKNRKQSEKTLTDFATKNSIGDEALTAFFNETVIPTFQALINQDLNEKMLSVLWKAHSFDREVADAQKMGEVKAANQKIVKEKETAKGDGLPSITSGGEKKAEEAPKKAMSSIQRIAQQNEEERRRIQ